LFPVILPISHHHSISGTLYCNCWLHRALHRLRAAEKQGS
jgi:hypothetical protein